MTDREVIARALVEIHSHPSVLDAEAILAALADAGRVIVPVEPTEAMTTQGCLAIMDTVLVGPPLIRKSYRAMLAAAGGGHD